MRQSQLELSASLHCSTGPAPRERTRLVRLLPSPPSPNSSSAPRNSDLLLVLQDRSKSRHAITIGRRLGRRGRLLQLRGQTFELTRIPCLARLANRGSK